jgi:hypothetical protein
VAAKLVIVKLVGVLQESPNREELVTRKLVIWQVAKTVVELVQVVVYVAEVAVVVAV